MTSSTIRAFTYLIILTAVLLLFGCRDTEPEQQTALTAEMPLHLEDHLDTAHAETSLFVQHSVGREPPSRCTC